MRSQNRWTGIVVGVVMGVLLSAAVVLVIGNHLSICQSY